MLLCKKNCEKVNLAYHLEYEDGLRVGMLRGERAVLLLYEVGDVGLQVLIYLWFEGEGVEASVARVLVELAFDGAIGIVEDELVHSFAGSLPDAGHGLLGTDGQIDILGISVAMIVHHYGDALVQFRKVGGVGTIHIDGILSHFHVCCHVFHI